MHLFSLVEKLLLLLRCLTGFAQTTSARNRYEDRGFVFSQAPGVDYSPVYPRRTHPLPLLLPHSPHSSLQTEWFFAQEARDELCLLFFFFSLTMNTR